MLEEAITAKKRSLNIEKANRAELPPWSLIPTRGILSFGLVPSIHLGMTLSHRDVSMHWELLVLAGF